MVNSLGIKLNPLVSGFFLFSLIHKGQFSFESVEEFLWSVVYHLKCISPLPETYSERILRSWDLINVITASVNALLKYQPNWFRYMTGIFCIWTMLLWGQNWLLFVIAGKCLHAISYIYWYHYQMTEFICLFLVVGFFACPGDEKHKDCSRSHSGP